MSEGQVKKLYIMQTLEVLKKYSDVNHHLKQKDIIKYLQLEYGVICERKAVARNISNLQDMGYEIEKDNGYYLLERTFEDSELRLLIDSVMASRHIPLAQSKMLIDKLVSQSSIYFKKQMRHISNLDRLNHDKTNVLFYNIDILNEAIDRKLKVKFFYNKKDVNFKPVHTTAKPHIVNPYQIIVANGRYYVIGNIDKYSNISHFRVEKISDIKIIEEPIKIPEKVDELKNGFNLPEHMMEHIYMFSGPSEPIVLEVDKSKIDDVIDWLGEEIYISEKENQQKVKVRVKANTNAMKYWAIQFGQSVEVLEPANLRQAVKDTLKEISDKYQE